MKLNNRVKLNNRGFAITGILYTLFILFLLILLSVLSGISLKRNMLQQSITSQEDSYVGTHLIAGDTTFDKIVAENKAIVTGKYVFSLENINTETKCFAYVTAGTTLDNSITYTPSDCNEYVGTTTMKLEEVYSFERE